MIYLKNAEIYQRKKIYQKQNLVSLKEVKMGFGLKKIIKECREKIKSLYKIFVIYIKGGTIC